MQLFRDFSFLFYYREEILLISMFFFHWLFDFVMQTDGDKKHKDTIILVQHTVYYSFMMTIVYVIVASYLHIPINRSFLPITFIVHTITDYFTSRYNAKIHEKHGPGKKLVNSIGFDQFLHHAQLFLTI